MTFSSPFGAAATALKGKDKCLFDDPIASAKILCWATWWSS
jgi:hypothetical protein